MGSGATGGVCFGDWEAAVEVMCSEGLWPHKSKVSGLGAGASGRAAGSGWCARFMAVWRPLAS